MMKDPNSIEGVRARRARWWLDNNGFENVPYPQAADDWNAVNDQFSPVENIAVKHPQYWQTIKQASGALQGEVILRSLVSFGVPIVVGVAVDHALNALGVPTCYGATIAGGVIALLGVPHSGRVIGDSVQHHRRARKNARITVKKHQLVY